MITPAGILVALGAAAYEPQVLGAMSTDRLRVVRRCVDIADLLAFAATRQAQAAVVSVELDGLDAETVARLTDEGVAVIGVTAAEGSVEEAILRGLGITFVVPAAEPVLLVEAVITASVYPLAIAEGQHRSEPDELPALRSRAGCVVAVWGPAGAPGRSVVALGLGAQLAELGLDSLVVDGDVYGGSLAQMLGMLDESSGLLAACRAANQGGLRGEGLSEHCRQISTNLRVLTGLPRADRWVEAKSVLVRTVLSAARELADVTVVDCGFCLELDEEISYDTTAPRRNGATIEILESADTLLVVGRPDPVGLSRLIRALTELRNTVPWAEPTIVINRVRKDAGWPQDEIAATLLRTTGVDRVMWLPDDPGACGRALLHGQTLVEAASGARLTRAFAKLAMAVGGERVETHRGRIGRRGR